MGVRAAILIISLSVLSCVKTEKKDDGQQKLDSIVNSKKDSLLFLSFWSGMSEQEFQSIINMENRNGNLQNGKFYFYIDNSEDSIGFDLQQSYDKKGIELNYKNEYWVKGDKYITPSISWHGTTYFEIEKALKKHFDNKYPSLDFTPKSMFSSSMKRWKINDVFPKVIELSWRYRVQNQSDQTWIFKPETSEYKLGECNFNILILAFHDYEQRELNRLESEKARQAEEDEQKKNKESKIKEKNSKL